MLPKSASLEVHLSRVPRLTRVRCPEWLQFPPQPRRRFGEDGQAGRLAVEGWLPFSPCWPPGTPTRPASRSWVGPGRPAGHECWKQRWVHQRHSGSAPVKRLETLGNGGGRGATACSGLCLTCLARHSVGHGGARTARWPLSARAQFAAAGEGQGEAVLPVRCWPAGPPAVRHQPL